MTTSRERMYWMKYKQYIHYDKKTNKYSYDPEMPAKAKLSFEKWLKDFYA